MKKLQIRRKYFQVTYPTKDQYVEYIKNSQNSKVKKKKNLKRKRTKDHEETFQ